MSAQCSDGVDQCTMCPQLHFSARATLAITCGVFLTTKMNQLPVVQIYSVEVMTILDFVCSSSFRDRLSDIVFSGYFFSQK